MSLTAAIFDDEPLARTRLRRLLSELDIEVIGEGENGEQAIDVVLNVEPDLLFLDIQMPHINGISAANSISSQLPHPPAIIFCTAFDEYAVEAFKANASAYLLKPFDLNDLKSSIDRSHALNRVQLSELNQQNSVIHYMPIGSGSSIEKINCNEIVLFQAHEKHVYATMTTERKILVDTPLKEIEKKYSDLFIRTSRSTIVNRNQILNLNSNHDGYTIQLNYKNKQIPVSRRKLSSVKVSILNSERDEKI